MSSSDNLDHELFIQLFLKHEKSVRAYARTLLPTKDSVDEVMQETSLIAWRKFSEFEVGTEFGRWMAGIMRYEALKLRRNLKHDRHVFSEELHLLLETEGLQEIGSMDLRQAALQKCVSRLSGVKQTMLALVYGSGLSASDASKNLNCSVNALYKSLQRVRTALLECAKRELAREESQ